MQKLNPTNTKKVNLNEKLEQIDRFIDTYSGIDLRKYQTL